MKMENFFNNSGKIDERAGFRLRLRNWRKGSGWHLQ